ncbi:MAG: hypothetical protein K6T90_20650, partial [Leptolyngbyaceae cyanobacterium HOT.MB2.61]|nr:hypothetical protein [Leptolyngbyaceae cyanobacterium HOT.MB2.61]
GGIPWVGSRRNLPLLYQPHINLMHYQKDSVSHKLLSGSLLENEIMSGHRTLQQRLSLKIGLKKALGGMIIGLHFKEG